MSDPTVPDAPTIQDFVGTEIARLPSVVCFAGGVSAPTVVCVVCARDEEAEAAADILRDLGGQRKVQGSPSDFTLEYYDIVGSGVSMRVWLTYAVDQSGDFMHAWMTRLLMMRPWGDKIPDLFLMTGVCAGKRGFCQLGDVMVASEACNYEFGKRVDDPHSGGDAYSLLPKPRCFKPDDRFVRWVRTVMHGKRTWYNRARSYSATTSPLTMYERYIFARTFVPLNPAEDFTAVNTRWLADQDLPRTGPLLAEKVIESFGAAVDDAEGLGHVFETNDGTIELSDAVRRTIVNSLKLYGVFPRPPRPPQFKEANFGPWGSGTSVRADTHKGKTIFFRGNEVGETRDSAVFAEVKQQNRDTIAVDMEAAAFYQQLHGVSHPAFLVVKAVCDFADSRKDDALHRYGKHAAASYALQLAVEFSSVPQRQLNDTALSTGGGGLGSYFKEDLQLALGDIASLTHFPAMRRLATPDVLAAVAGSSCVVACAWTGEQAGGAEGGERWGRWLARDVLGQRSTSHVPWIVWSDEVAKNFQYHREIHGLGGLSVREEPQVQVVRGLVAAVVRQGFDRAAAVRADGERLEQEERGRLERLHTREVTPRNVQLLLLGQARVGKTCLFRALQGLEFQKCLSTVDHVSADLAASDSGVLRRPESADTGERSFDCMDPAYLGAVMAHNDLRQSPVEQRVTEPAPSARAVAEDTEQESETLSTSPAAQGPAAAVAEERTPAAAERPARKLDDEAKRMQQYFDETKVPLGSDAILFRVFDFAGQEQYYATHHLFLRNRAVCLLVFRVRDLVVGDAAGTETGTVARNEGGVGRLSAVQYLIFWLNSLRVHASEAAVLLVGVYCTGAKYVSQEHHYIEETLLEHQLQVCEEVLKAMHERCGSAFECVWRRTTEELFFPLETPEVRAGDRESRAGRQMGELWDELKKAADENLSRAAQPFRWFHTYFVLKQQPQVVLRVSDISEIFSEFAEDERDRCLQYFHDLGRILIVTEQKSGCGGKFVLPDAERFSNAVGALLCSSRHGIVQGSSSQRRCLRLLGQTGRIQRARLAELLRSGVLRAELGVEQGVERSAEIEKMTEPDADAVVECLLRFNIAVRLREPDVLLIPSCVVESNLTIPADWSACNLVAGFEIWAFVHGSRTGQRVLVPCILPKLVVKLLPELQTDSDIRYRRGYVVLHGLRGFTVLVEVFCDDNRIRCHLKRKFDDFSRFSEDMTPTSACSAVQQALDAVVKETFVNCGDTRVNFAPYCTAGCGRILQDWPDGAFCECNEIPVASLEIDFSCWSAPGGFSREELERAAAVAQPSPRSADGTASGTLVSAAFVQDSASRRVSGSPKSVSESAAASSGCGRPQAADNVMKLRYRRLKQNLGSMTSEALADLRLVFELQIDLEKRRCIQKLETNNHISARSMWKVVRALRDGGRKPWLNCDWYSELLEYHKEVCHAEEPDIVDIAPERYRFVHLRRALIIAQVPEDATISLWDTFELGGETPVGTEAALDKMTERGPFTPNRLREFARTVREDEFLGEYYGGTDWYKDIVSIT